MLLDMAGSADGVGRSGGGPPTIAAVGWVADPAARMLAGGTGDEAVVVIAVAGPQHFAEDPYYARVIAGSGQEMTRQRLRWLWRDRDMRDVTLVAGLVSALDGAWFAVLVLYVVRDLHQQPGAYGLLLAIGALGGVATGGLGAILTRRLGPWRSLLLGGVAMAASQAGLGLTSNVIVAAAMLFISSGAWALFNITAVTMRQRQVPAALLGRVSSLFGIVTRGTEALGALAGGALAVSAGLRAPMLAGAPPLAVAVAVLAWRHRGRRA
jgi:predicted MFS family arabinose efflux permease